MEKWHVILEPGGENVLGKTTTGLIIYLKRGYEKKEVSRVAFVRRHGSIAKPFKSVLREQIDHAQHSADTMNEHLDKSPTGRLL